jgi:thiol-disulfide isomerase/thioredoxin
MAEAMDGKKLTKNERRRAAAEAREAARRRQVQRRALGYVLGGAALIAIVVVAVFAVLSGAEPSGDAAVRLVRPGLVSSSGGPRTEMLAAGDEVPDFTAPAIGGGTFRWSDYEGAPTVVSIWAPWCSHCQAELPLLNRVMQGYPDVQWVTIVTGIGDQPGPDAGVFLADNDITAPTAIDDTTRELASVFGLEAYPTLVFIGSDGVTVDAMTGEVDEATLRSLIGSLT